MVRNVFRLRHRCLTDLEGFALPAPRGLSVHGPKPLGVDPVIGAVFLQFEEGSIDRFTEFAPLGENETIVLNVEERADDFDSPCPFIAFIMEDEGESKSPASTFSFRSKL